MCPPISTTTSSAYENGTTQRTTTTIHHNTQQSTHLHPLSPARVVNCTVRAQDSGWSEGGCWGVVHCAILLYHEVLCQCCVMLGCIGKVGIVVRCASDVLPMRCVVWCVVLVIYCPTEVMCGASGKKDLSTLNVWPCRKSLPTNSKVGWYRKINHIQLDYLVFLSCSIRDARHKSITETKKLWARTGTLKKRRNQKGNAENQNGPPENQTEQESDRLKPKPAPTYNGPSRKTLKPALRITTKHYG